MQWPIFIAYTALVWLVFVKFRLLRLSLAWALLFAAAGPVVLVAVLIAMNFQHPGTSDVRVLNRVVQLAPRVSRPGRVEEVSVRANVPVLKGDVLFRIDPKPFRFEVDRLEAALAASRQGVPELRSALDAASAAKARTKAQTELAQVSYDRQARLVGQKVAAQATLDDARRNLDAATQAEAVAAAQEEAARLQLDSNIGGENTSVAQVRQQLLAAQDDLVEADVKAPCDGFSTNVNILPGQVIAPGVAVMPFVCNQEPGDRGKVVATFEQGSFLAIHPGDRAEVVFAMYPGQILPATVLYTVDITGSGQIGIGGIIPSVATDAASPRFAAVLQLDDRDLRLPAGAKGTGAVYTDGMQFAATFRKGLVRTDSILNYMAWGT